LKLFILLIIAAFVCAFLFLRLRPYFLLARRILNLARDGGRDQHNINAATQSSPRARSAVAGKLSRCSTCGLWIPASRALALRSSTAVYCSNECLERAASVTEQKDTRRAAGKHF